MTKILLIEDNPKHVADAIVLLEERIAQGAPLTFDHAATFDDAMNKLSSMEYNGILSDVFFPKSTGGAEEQHGTDIATYAMTHNIPWVLVTSTYHHQAKTEPVSEFVRSCDLELVDCCPQFKKEDDSIAVSNRFDSPTKNWKAGYATLMYFMELSKRGLVRTEPRGRSSFDHSAHFVSDLQLTVASHNEDRSEYRPSINSALRFFASGADLRNPEKRKQIVESRVLGTSNEERVLGPNAFFTKVLNNEYCRGLYPIQ